MTSPIIVQRTSSSGKVITFGLDALTDVYANTVSGDRVIYEGGDIDLTTLGIQLKDGVSWLFIGNPTIASDSALGTFYDSNSAVTVHFDGDVIITNTNGAASRAILGNASTIVYNLATGLRANAQGYSPTASGAYSHAEGFKPTASGYGSHAEGGTSTASGDYSHAEGLVNVASGYGSHAEGNLTTAQNLYQHTSGKNNIGTSTTTILEVGIGTSQANKLNGLEVHTNGQIVIANIPTSDPSVAGSIWNNSGVLNISAG